jgi:hypothetical protein
MNELIMVLLCGKTHKQNGLDSVREETASLISKASVSKSHKEIKTEQIFICLAQPYQTTKQTITSPRVNLNSFLSH